jgi:hypothetical protein
VPVDNPFAAVRCCYPAIAVHTNRSHLCLPQRNESVLRMRIGFPVFGPYPRSGVCSATRTRGSSPWFGGQKKACGSCGRRYSGWYDRTRRRVRDLPCGAYRTHLPRIRRAAGGLSHCGRVKRERLEFLADNALCSKRFAYYVGRRCLSATVKDVAKELHLDWHSVKELDKQYMRAQWARAGTPDPRPLGSMKSRSASATPIASWSATDLVMF